MGLIKDIICLLFEKKTSDVMIYDVSVVCAKGYKKDGTNCVQCGVNEHKDQVSDATTCTRCTAPTSSTNGAQGATSASACGNISLSSLLKFYWVIS